MGAHTLVDGIQGNTAFSDGKWLGFEGDDLELTLDLGTAKRVDQIRIGFYKDEGSWIFLPQSFGFSYSLDGDIYSEVQLFNSSDISNKDGSIYEGLIKVQLPEAVQHFKIIAKNIGTCPEGHPGAGGKAWLFVDEIIIE